MTQKQMVLQYMKDFGSITQGDAYNDLGCMRLASRIDELKKAGFNIKAVTEHGRNRYGKHTSYARYSLE